ncbi:Crp/Fnr family transcriptional regulator [Aquiflexum gelatinilyticum]|jgi:CRP/FNR family transcriptional regulator|uniref:Crp/Fnr family transcriptional regulator n=1 Tax=Aquiflexum gelatinilyticum TaxID=2961943 RepID=A0A9X2SXA1_9BACT|nr:Crp/Fnr family transcriptional regulator [Aquiflexum gelatinilyticum]MCR9013442.1 Crp/Fnr family transcriptional regulator [Aquiflexum gelatinilyticum]MCS4436483.1 Crp/Fnr family transcriptional regulator [Aquiflexum gelatinilyticum]
MMGAKGDFKGLLKANFPQFENELFQEIIKEGQLVLFPEGELMMDIGQRVELIPLIVKGTVKIFREDEDDHEIFLYYLKEGEACAITLICSAREGHSKIKAIPIEDTTAIVLPIKKLDEWMFKYKSWYYFVMDSYQEKFEELLKVVEEIAFHQMDERLLAYLRKSVEANNSNIIKATHQQIAGELNTSREVVGRLLKKLEQNGTVIIGRNQIELIN